MKYNTNTYPSISPLLLPEFFVLTHAESIATLSYYPVPSLLFNHVHIHIVYTRCKQPHTAYNTMQYMNLHLTYNTYIYTQSTTQHIHLHLVYNTIHTPTSAYNITHTPTPSV